MNVEENEREKSKITNLITNGIHFDTSKQRATEVIATIEKKVKPQQIYALYKQKLIHKYDDINILYIVYYTYICIRYVYCIDMLVILHTTI